MGVEGYWKEVFDEWLEVGGSEEIVNFRWGGVRGVQKYRWMKREAEENLVWNIKEKWGRDIENVFDEGEGKWKIGEVVNWVYHGLLRRSDGRGIEKGFDEWGEESGEVEKW